jgi:anti-sigma regulatory factor (Ser/Thr protein kinase)
MEKLKNSLSKFLHNVTKPKDASPQTVYPKLEGFSSYENVKQRSITGWIAYQMAKQLSLNETQTDLFFLKPFMQKEFQEQDEHESEIIMQLAQSATGWIQNDSLVEEEIKQLNLSTAYNKVLSRVIREVQSEKDFQEKAYSESKAIWNVYRDVIYSASQGHFLLVEKSDLIHYKSGKLLCEADIKERGDIPLARNAASEVFEQVNLKPSKMMSYKLIISEAVTNVLKHAEYGKLLIYQDELTNTLRVIIEDTGRGFPLKILPQTTLMAGFSTKKSMGQGFTLMLKMADQLVLETSTSGSTLILILKGESENIENKVEPGNDNTKNPHDLQVI